MPAERVEQRLRRAADLILTREVLPGPAPLPDFERLLRRGRGWDRAGRLVLLAGLAAAVALVSVVLLGGRRDVSYVVDGPVTVSGAVVEALASPGSESPPARMHFSEGSEIALSNGARMRVANRGSHGADLVLERGHAALNVAHRAGARWSVTSGPFTVEVVGTTFSLDWSPAEERMVVDLTAGRVRIRGVSVGGPIEMTSGERLVASVRDHRVTLAPLNAPPAIATATATATATADASAEPLAPPADHAVPPQPAGGVAAAGAPVGGPRRRISRSAARAQAPGPVGARRASELALASPTRVAGPRPGRPALPSSSEEFPAAVAGWSSGSSPNPSAPTPPAAATPYPETPDLWPSTFAAPVVPTMTLGGGGVFCSRETAQYRFEQPEEGISVANVYTLALANPDLDSTHSWCGAGAVRLRASFTDQGRRNYFGRYLRETGQMIIRLDRPTDFTGRTVTMHVFVEGPSDARFSAEIFVVHQGHWVGSEPMRELTPGRWWTVKHTFKALNPTGGSDSSNPLPYPGEGLSPVSACNRVSLAIRTTGPRLNWTGAVYVDDVGWR
jgi:hypothetical protein